MEQKYDIFISYKRKSLPTANNLYYRLTTRGYSTFFDLEEMGRDNFNTQLLAYIDAAKDVFVILEEGSLDACKTENWEKDWFCQEIAFAIKKGKNIIPILIGGYKMPPQDFFPNELKEFSLKNSPEFNFSFFEAYLDKLIAKKYLLSKPNLKEKVTSIFKFYSNENCQVFKEGKMVCSLEGNSDEPYYLPVLRKGDYRFKVVNTITLEKQLLKEHVDADEEKDVDIEWNNRLPLKPDQEWPEQKIITGENFLVDLGVVKFNMIRVEGGEYLMGATPEQEADSEANEYPVHNVKVKTFYIGQFPITQNIWEVVMGYNKSCFKDKEEQLSMTSNVIATQGGNVMNSIIAGSVLGGTVVGAWSGLPILGATAAIANLMGRDWIQEKIKKFMNPESSEIGHYPIENISYSEVQEFIRRLSKMTNISFSIPTEEEWEFAARGGHKNQGYKYAGSNNIDDVAWYKDNSGGTTHPVGEKMPNELGLYDMCGNVWEWTETHAHSYGVNIEAKGDIFIRRGGSWWHEAKNCRVSRRYTSNCTKKTSGLGLRVIIRENIYNDDK